MLLAYNGRYSVVVWPQCYIFWESGFADDVISWSIFDFDAIKVACLLTFFHIMGHIIITRATHAYVLHDSNWYRRASYEFSTYSPFSLFDFIVIKYKKYRLPSVGFRSWSRFLAVSLRVTWVINPAVGCHYFPLGPQLPPQPLRGLLPISLLGEQKHDGCEQFA